MKAAAELFLRVITFNIRYAATSPFEGEEPWDVRKQYTVNTLNFHSRPVPETFIGLQEALHDQLVDVKAGLNDGVGEWDHIGVGREDGKEEGEYSPILYRTDVWDLDFHETIWLSETPEKPSKGWDASTSRVATFGVFTHKENQKKILAANTHLDHVGPKSRLESVKLIQKTIADIQKDKDVTKAYLSGDFNSVDSDGAYKEMTKEGSLYSDVRHSVEKEKQHGNFDTYVPFGDEAEPNLLDYVFVTPAADSPWSVKGYSVPTNKFDDGVMFSDHRPVIADLELN